VSGTSMLLFMSFVSCKWLPLRPASLALFLLWVVPYACSPRIAYLEQLYWRRCDLPLALCTCPPTPRTHVPTHTHDASTHTHPSSLSFTCSSTSAGRDPFEWLPDELLLPIFLVLPVGMLCAAVPARVCRRWYHLWRDPRVQRRVKQGKWEAYACGAILPRSLDVSRQFGAINTLAVGSDGRWVFSGASDDKISVWSGLNGTLSRTLTGHMGAVLSLAVGTRAPSTSHQDAAEAAVDNDANTDGSTSVTATRDALALLYSGSSDTTVRVWCTRSWTTVRVLRGHTEAVKSLAVGPKGTLYSGGYVAARTPTPTLRTHNPVYVQAHTHTHTHVTHARAHTYTFTLVCAHAQAHAHTRALTCTHRTVRLLCLFFLQV
jgi:hypothetical protein